MGRHLLRSTRERVRRANKEIAETDKEEEIKLQGVQRILNFRGREDFCVSQAVRQNCSPLPLSM